MFWNNQLGKEKEKEKERKRRRRREKKIYVFIERTERCPFYLTPCPRGRKKIENHKSNIDPNTMLLLLLCIFIHLAGSLVAFDTTFENYTVPVSGKCILTCYIADVRSFKVSHWYFFVYVYGI